MSYYLEVKNLTSSRWIVVDIPAPTNSGGYNYRIKFEVRVSGTELIVNSSTQAGTAGACFVKSTALEYRSPTNANINMTHGVSIADWHTYELVFTGSGQGNIAFYVDDVFKANYTPSVTIGNSAWLSLLGLASASRLGDFRYFEYTDFNNSSSNRMYDARAHVAGNTVLRETANNVNGTFSSAWTSLPPNFIADAPVTTPISFTGNIANQVFTVGDSVDVDLAAGNYSGTETPFAYSNSGTALTGTGLSITSAGRLQGTATETTVTGVIMRGTDTATNIADSNSFNVTVSAPAALSPQGSVTIGSITVGETTATIPYTYNNTDQTGFEYRINGGTPASDAASPVDLTGLTAGTAYTIEVRAVNATGAGSWSELANFTTNAVTPTAPRIVFTSAKALVYITGSLRASETGFTIHFNNVDTNELLVSYINQPTDSNGVLPTIQSDLLPTAGNQVRVTIVASDGAECVFRETTQ